MNKIILAAAVLFMCAVSSRATLTPSQLTTKERATYNKLGGGSAAANAFLATREYVRICKTITKANAASLPDMPSNYDGTYVTLDEQKMVDNALDLSFAALVGNPTALA